MVTVEEAASGEGNCTKVSGCKFEVKGEPSVLVPAELVCIAVEPEELGGWLGLSSLIAVESAEVVEGSTSPPLVTSPVDIGRGREYIEVNPS
jgi:hypothetical protein